MDRSPPPPRVVILPPRPEAPAHVDVAHGIRAVWASALHACGADVFCPTTPLPGDLELQDAVFATRGIALTHATQGDHARDIDAIVCACLAFTGVYTQLPVTIVRVGHPGLPDLHRGELRHRGQNGLLRAMASTLLDLGDCFNLPIPPDVTWQDLLGVRSGTKALSILRIIGHEERTRAEVNPEPAIN
jgi:hypothetical protein